MEEHNNSFYDARAANQACQEHVCTDNCPRNSNGCCLAQIALWQAQHRAALRWNQPEDERPTAIVEPERGYL